MSRKGEKKASYIAMTERDDDSGEDVEYYDGHEEQSQRWEENANEVKDDAAMLPRYEAPTNKPQLRTHIIGGACVVIFFVLLLGFGYLLFTSYTRAPAPSPTTAVLYTCSANELSSTSVTVVQLTRAEDLPCWLSPKNKYWAWFHDTLCQQPNTLYLLRSNSTHLLVSCFSNVFGGPLWVVEPPATVRERDSCANNCDCPPNFLTNGQGIPSTINGRSFQPFTYQGSPLDMDRGHLAPRADYFCCTTKILSCHVINRAPQYKTVNSGKWNEVELTVRRVELQNGSYVPFIFTYLLYPSNWSNYRTPEKDSGFNTAVPLNFTKVIYSDMEMTQAICIVQDNLPDKANKPVDTRYLTWADCPSELKSRFLSPQTMGDSFYSAVIAARS